MTLYTAPCGGTLGQWHSTLAMGIKEPNQKKVKAGSSGEEGTGLRTAEKRGE